MNSYFVEHSILPDGCLWIEASSRRDAAYKFAQNYLNGTSDPDSMEDILIDGERWIVWATVEVTYGARPVVKGALCIRLPSDTERLANISTN